MTQVQPRLGECELIVALDTPSLDDARKLVESLRPEVKWFKVGLELYTAHGQAALSMVRDAGAEVFCDLKLHDIPNTVAGAARVLATADVGMFNVHAGGGREMMTAAQTAAVQAASADRKPLVLAVTVLTSLDQSGWGEVYQNSVDPLSQVVHMAKLTQAAGLDGVVCSVREAAAVRTACGPQFAIVTPGVRPASAAVNDQKRVATPTDAVRAGATHIVVGRPITAAADPRQAALEIMREMAGATANTGYRVP